MTDVYLLNGHKFQTEISLNALKVLYSEVAERRATIIIQAFWQGTEGALDIRKIDPDTTFRQDPKTPEPTIVFVTVYG